MNYAETIKELVIRLDLVRQAPMAQTVEQLLDKAHEHGARALRRLDENVPEHVVTDADPSELAVRDELAAIAGVAKVLLDNVDMGPKTTESVDKLHDCVMWAGDEL